MAHRTITHRQRLEACLDGDILDRVPVALWRHFPVDDQSPDGLAAAISDFQKRFDFDLIKVTPASSFCTKDWGTRDKWAGNPEGTREYTHHPIQKPEDWETLPVLDPQKGFLGAQLENLRLVVNEFGDQTPVLQTVFSPMSQAKNLVGAGNLLAHLHRSPDSVEKGLQTITETTLRFVEAVHQIQPDGLFYAVQQAQYHLLSEAEFEKFEKPFDLKILESAGDFWFNLLHLHGQEIMFDQVMEYPVQAINWHDRNTSPSLAEASEKYRGILCGGLQQWDTLVLGTPEQVMEEAAEAIHQTNGRRFILGTGCVLPITAPYGNILAARQIVDRMGEM